jgi:hypothetical protein
MAGTRQPVGVGARLLNKKIRFVVVYDFSYDDFEPSVPFITAVSSNRFACRARVCSCKPQGNQRETGIISISSHFRLGGLRTNRCKSKLATKSKLAEDQKIDHLWRVPNFDYALFKYLVNFGRRQFLPEEVSMARSLVESFSRANGLYVGENLLAAPFRELFLDARNSEAYELPMT